MKKFLKTWLSMVIVFIAINICNFSVYAYNYTYTTRSKDTPETVEIVAYIIAAIISMIIEKSLNCDMNF